MNWLDLLQWPGMALGLAGAWLVRSPERHDRRRGFALWVVSNTLLLAWACNLGAWGIVCMQSAYLWLAWSGMRNNR